MSKNPDDPKPKPPTKVTLKTVDAKIEDVLEMTDVLQSELSEMKEVLKSLLELQLGLQKDTKQLPSTDNHDSMFS